MKKLSLKNLKLEASDMLQRDQLKTVFGGYGGGDSNGTCRAYWPNNKADTIRSTTFSADFMETNGDRTDFIGVNAKDAENLAKAKPGGRWCCSSCSTASWL